MPLLEINELEVRYPAGHGAALGRAVVDGVSLSVEAGRCVGLVGESGCGKTTLGRAVLGLVPHQGGTIRFDGALVGEMTRRAMMKYRRLAQMVFQDPLGSLDPRQTIGSAIGEVLHVHRVCPPAAVAGRVAELLQMVGLAPEFARRYPHETSGGQRQRVGIARVLALAPRLIIADEPVSALDVSIQAQVLNLFKDLQQSLGFACLFIAHDLAVVRYMCSEVQVMFMGRIVESGPCADVIDQPRHPYTRQLLESVPRLDGGVPPRSVPAVSKSGDTVAGAPAGRGCVYAPRCPECSAACMREMPPLMTGSAGRSVACFGAGARKMT